MGFHNISKATPRTALNSGSQNMSFRQFRHGPTLILGNYKEFFLIPDQVDFPAFRQEFLQPLQGRGLVVALGHGLALVADHVVQHRLGEHVAHSRIVGKAS